MSLEMLVAKDAIREVIDRFSNLECDVAAQGQYFTQDTAVQVYMNGELTMDIHGLDELTKQFSAFTVGVKASHHMNGQQVITVDGDTATDEHYCIATLVVPEGDKNYITVNYIRYIDTLVKSDEKWLIKNREQHFVITDRREI